MRLGTRMFSSVNTKSLVFGIVIIFACVAFIFTGFGSLHVSNLNSMDPNTAATVGSVTIGINEFVNVMNEQGLSNVAGAEKKYMAAQVIKQLINQKILANEALKIGWQVSDNEIASAIKAVPIFQDPTSHQFSMTLFKNYIANQQTSEVDFYNYLRTQLDIQKMQNLIFMPVVIPNSVAQFQYDINNTQFNLQYAVITLPENSLRPKIEAEAKKFVDNKANLKQLQDLYASQKDQFNQKAKTHVRSILIAYKGANRAQGAALDRTKEDALKVAQNILSQVKQGSDFSKLAGELNDDNTAKQAKGDLGFVDDSTIDPTSLTAIALLTKQNPLTNVVDTPFGYRIFQYVENKPAVTKNFEDVKIELAKQIIGNQIKIDADNSFQTKLASALSSQNITQINTLLVDNGISWQYLGKPFKVTDTNIAELGNPNSLSEEIFSLKKSGDIIPKIINFGAKKVVIKLDSVTQPTPSTQTDLDGLKKQMMTDQSQLFAQSAQQYFTKEYDKNGKIKINPIITE